MGRIHLLDDDVVNKIAAGEVVERPASVVKELVENAIDAGAKSIEVSLELGGTRSIVVTDDGSGMGADDARLALKRHATSKIRRADDLFAIGTMGFRGEALASIASVSRLSLATMERAAPGQPASPGLKLTVNGGEDAHELPFHGPAGTTIAVENLFFNLPVRAKFLKAPATELSHCLELIQAFALCHPAVAFTLKHNGREQFRVPAVAAAGDGPLLGEAALTERARLVLGKDAGALIYLRVSSRHGDLEALVSPPGIEKATGRHIQTFVNGRWVKDKVLRYGVLRGYHSHLLKGRFPVAVLHLRLDPTLVDVNVHPAKSEVRFQYGDEVQSLIALGIRDRLRDAAWAGPPAGEGTGEGPGAPGMGPWAAGGALRAEPSVVAYARPLRGGPAGGPPGLDAGRTGSATPGGGPPGLNAVRTGSASPGGADDDRASSEARFAGGGRGAADGRFPGGGGGARALFASGARSSGSVSTRSFGASAGAGGSDWSPPAIADKAGVDALLAGMDDGADRAAGVIPWADLEYLGAFDRCYLLFATEGRLLAVDQHAFHERILFERLVRDTSLLSQSQALLVPESVELSPTSVATLRGRAAQLAQRGFDFQIDGATTVLIRAVPSLLASCDLESLFADLAGDAAADADDLNHGTHEPADSTAELARLILAKTACHAAVRSGEDLPPNELAQLLGEARTVDFYHTCPHGRRVFKWWSRAQVAHWFDR